MEHPVIKRVHGAAELLEIQQDKTDPDEAMIRLAAWMDLAIGHLTEDDPTVLVGIGAPLYRDGLAQDALTFPQPSSAQRPEELDRTMSKTTNSDVSKQMAAAGLTSEQLAEAVLVERVARLLEGAAPKPPEWFEGTGMTYGGEIGDYGPVDAEMATVVWDDRKFAECYSNEDADWLAEALKQLYPKR